MIGRIETACRRQTPEPLIYGRSCAEFIQFITAATALATGGAAHDRINMR